jgi:rare lipoprotein A
MLQLIARQRRPLMGGLRNPADPRRHEPRRAITAPRYSQTPTETLIMILRAGLGRVAAALAFAAIAAPSFSQPTASTPATAAPPVLAPAVAGATVENGRIAWYGKKFAGRRTASGERYNPEALTMAHKTLPFGTRVKVTNPKNKKSTTLRVNDRGPTQADRVGDVSLAAAPQLGMLHAGVIDAELDVVAASPAKKR